MSQLNNSTRPDQYSILSAVILDVESSVFFASKDSKNIQRRISSRVRVSFHRYQDNTSGLQHHLRKLFLSVVHIFKPKGNVSAMLADYYPLDLLVCIAPRMHPHNEIAFPLAIYCCCCSATAPLLLGDDDC